MKRQRALKKSRHVLLQGATQAPKPSIAQNRVPKSPAARHLSPQSRSAAQTPRSINELNPKGGSSGALHANTKLRARRFAPSALCQPYSQTIAGQFPITSIKTPGHNLAFHHYSDGLGVLNIVAVNLEQILVKNHKVR